MTTDELGAVLRRRADLMRWRAQNERLEAEEAERRAWQREQRGRQPGGGRRVDHTHGRTA